MAEYRLLALDLDGTLLNQDKEISNQSKTWITRAKESGVTVVFATGRGYQKVEHLRVELGLNIPMVLVNGAEVWKSSRELLDRRFLKKEDIRKLRAFAVDSGAAYWGYSVDSLTKSTDWTEDMFKKDWLKFGMKHADLSVVEELKKKIATLADVEVTSSAPHNIECAVKGVSKEIGLRKICKHFEIDMKEVVAIGDNLNDLNMIKSAGLGIAMGNADAELKKIADAQTETNENDGVAAAIKKYLF